MCELLIIASTLLDSGMGYRLSSTVRFNRIGADRAVQIDAGSGDARACHRLETDDPHAFYTWLLSTGEQEFEDLVASAAKHLELESDESKDLVQQFMASGVFVESSEDTRAERLVRSWSEFGWRDAAEFHAAYFGLSFLPDIDGGVTYQKMWEGLLRDPGPVGVQPEHYAPKATREAMSVPVQPLEDGLVVEEVLNRAMPINKLTGATPELGSVMAGLTDSVGVQRVVGGSLGAHQQRSYPSGGARHPLEVYLVSKGIDGLPPGAYWFDPITHELHPRNLQIVAEEVDAACFGKGGIVSSRVVVTVTCRWLRHSWKYRYSRSYRMILLELGHLIQSVNLSMRARGVDVYQCPAIDDSRWLDLLDLHDEGQEGPLYVLGLGKGGRI